MRKLAGIVITFGFAMRFLGILLAVGLVLYGLDAAIEKGRAPAAASVEAKVIDAPTSDDLAIRAPENEIVAVCGKPARVWVTTGGRGQALGEVKHLWYPRIPAEIDTLAAPNSADERMRYWMFLGASPSTSKSADYYEGEELKKRMPCMARWVDVSLRAEKQLGLR